MFFITFLRKFRAVRINNFCSINTTQVRNMVENGPKKARIEVDPKTIGTHSGTFHCDEVLAVYLLQQLPEFRNHKLLRTRDQQLLDLCDIVVDVGSAYNPTVKRYDHHQSTFQESFSSLRPELGKISDVR